MMVGYLVLSTKHVFNERNSVIKRVNNVCGVLIDFLY